MDASITVIASLTALAAVIFAPLVSIYVANKQISAQVISANRQVWINQLSNELATFIREVRHVPSSHGARTITTAQAIERYENLALREETIKLMLDPTEAEHEDLLKLLASASEKTRKAINANQSMAVDQDEVAKLIVASARSILNKERDRVKNGK